MSDNNEKPDFFFMLKGLNKSIQARKEKQQDDHRILKQISSIVEENVQDMKNAQIEDEQVPLFLRNHFEEQGKPIPKEIIKKYSDIPEELKADRSGTQIDKKVETEEEKSKKPEKLLQKKIIKELAAKMKTVVFGQDETIDEIVDVLKVATLNIKINKEKPAGCYLLSGPTGCGKTEIANTLALFLGDEMRPIPIKKFNMGEYGMENDVTKLIGPPPGYKGADEGGQLTNFVSDNPISIILLDELEKAHPSIDKILLSIMDHGSCTDNHGKNVSFKNTIIISTSNLGAEIEYETNITKEEKDEYRMQAIKDGLRPEIINRYDSVFHCNSISKEVYSKILNKFLKSLTESIKSEHQIDLSYSPKLIDWAVEISYDPAMGGRPARKFIEKIVIKPLADQMIEDKINSQNHSEITLDLNKDNNVCFKTKRGKILGIMENTSELVNKVQQNKFTKKPRP